MIDLSYTCITTENDEESERLIDFALSLGYTMEAGREAMLKERVFHFKPSRTVATTSLVVGEVYKYSDLFGDMERELKDIYELALKFCKTYKCDTVLIYDNDNNSHSGNYESVIRASNVQGRAFELHKKKISRKITMKDIEEKFGGPVEIVS